MLSKTEGPGILWSLGGADTRPRAPLGDESPDVPRNLILAGLFAASSFVAACGGQSVEHSDDDGKGGTSGASGSTNGGASGTSGSSVGGNSGTTFGGTSAGGTFAGGTSAGGTSAGGTSGGVAGTGGAAGAGGICSLPLETGPCDAYVPSFGFNQAEGRCVPFVYGGCGGNGNRFSTLVECEAACGGSLSKCPPRMPMPAACPVDGEVCTYDVEQCLCIAMASLACSKVDPECTAGLSDAGVSPIAIGAYHQCRCGIRGWRCNVFGR
jgi:Kunitz/Bovine pancreatic trypsin inhibitor domain